jgi:hypothetical protein
LLCFSIVVDLAKKYNPSNYMDIYLPSNDINKVLEPVYDNCEKWEEMEMLLFINDNSEFTKDSIPHLDEAILKCDREGPKKHLVFMRELLDEHDFIKTKYMDTTFSMAISKGK